MLVFGVPETSLSTHTRRRNPVGLALLYLTLFLFADLLVIIFGVEFHDAVEPMLHSLWA